MTSWTVNDAAITSPAVSYKGSEDTTNGTLENRGEFAEVLEETTESDIAQ